jgi:para-aminobenzoate synthetase component I
MRPIIQECRASETPDALAARLRGEPGLILLRSQVFESPHARYSFVAARPFLTFRSFGSRCELSNSSTVQYGNPWRLLDSLMSRFELLDEIDLPFPLGGCFGYWGYDLKNFVEPRLPRRAAQDLELPDAHVGFYDSLVVFDHRLGKQWIISTGLNADGERCPSRAATALEWWKARLAGTICPEQLPQAAEVAPSPREQSSSQTSAISVSVSRQQYLAAVQQAQELIRLGVIYQVNLAQRFAVACASTGWELYERLSAVSPAPFSAFVDCGEFQMVSSSPELFLRLSGSQILTRPIKGTRARSSDPTRDAQLTYELQTSPKEMAELVMITDLLRNDLGKVCEFGSVQVPELVRLERYAHVQHLVSTVEGQLRPGVSHFEAFASCFPGGSITGAPKIKAMEIIDELEPIARGPYTGALGYLGFNRESQLSILIRAAIRKEATAYFYAGAGIVADSNPEAEYDETLAKAGGFFETINRIRATPEQRTVTW